MITIPMAQQSGTLPHRQVSVEVVVPVYNEQEALPKSIPALCAYLETYFPYRWSVVIADNASTDATLSVAENLGATNPRVSVLHLEEKGRGRALKAAWVASEADVVAYMDVDLSTNLWSFLPLVAPLATGHSDVAIGSRLLRGAMVTRQWKREVISRCYNLLIKILFGNHFSDAQCGFKAIKRGVAQELLPQVEDGEWFFDTELLLLAEERCLRISEVPVDWIEDLHSPDGREGAPAGAGAAPAPPVHRTAVPRSLGCRPPRTVPAIDSRATAEARKASGQGSRAGRG